MNEEEPLTEFRRCAEKIDQIRARLGDLASNVEATDPSIADDLRDVKLELAEVADLLERMSDV